MNRTSDSKHKKKAKIKNTCRIVNVAVPVDHRVWLERKQKKKDRYLDLARVLKTPWDTEVTVTPILIMTIQDYKNRPKYCEESWRLEETCYHLNSSEEPSANAGVKNSQ